jgi:hypothetical protein
LLRLRAVNYDGLKKLEGRYVNLLPQPYWVQGQRRTPMQWLMNRVNRRRRVAELEASSGHFKNLASVIHHYDEVENALVLDGQLIIDGHTVSVRR